MNYNANTLWNFITQPNAALASRQMYYGDTFVESDLVNSYAWDTAIVYIQAMGNTNYANANSSGTLNDTGDTTSNDQKCKIYDMAGNLSEWSTEKSTYKVNAYFSMPLALRGDNCGDGSSSYYCRTRFSSSSGDAANGYKGFRPLLYVKSIL